MRHFQPRRGMSLALSLVMLFSLSAPAAAAGTEGGGDTTTEEKLTITLDKEKLDMVTTEKENTASLRASVKKGETAITSVKIDWTSSNEKIVTVAPVETDTTQATVTALDNGTATITASYIVDDKNTEDSSDDEKVTASCTVSVTTPVTSVSVTPKDSEINLNDEPLSIKATVLPANATEKGVTWDFTNIGDSLKEPVISLSNTGVVTPLRPGKVLVTVTTKDGEWTAESNVTVNGVYLNEHELELMVGKNKNVFATCYGNKAEEYKNSLQWISSNSAIASVKNGKITAVAPGTATITVYAGAATDTIELTVLENTQTIVKATRSAEANTRYDFYEALADDIVKIADEDFDSELIYMNNISVPTNQGILYYGYVSPDTPGHGVGGSEKYFYMDEDDVTRENAAFTDITFVPKADFSGTAEITYTGHCADGRSFTGVIRVEVYNSGDVMYETAEERVLPLASEDFSAVCVAKTGKSLRYVTFSLPNESRGVLYYNYSESGQFSPKVSANTPYYVAGGNTLLDNVSFLPAAGFTGTLKIPYVATNSSNTSFNGTMTINVFPADGSGLGANVSYDTAPSAPVTFDEEDFADVCPNGRLDYILIPTLPDPEQGSLYYKYKTSSDIGSLVSAGTRYFVNDKDNPEIENITFVSAPNFTGTVIIPYTGYPTGSGQRYEGNIILRVSGDASTVTYSTTSRRAVAFNGLDFNQVCQDSLGTAMNTVSFEPPPSGQGTLYYKYGTNSSEVVESDDSFSQSRLDDVTFVPRSAVTGAVTFPFSGYDRNGTRFSGTVVINVGAATGDDVVEYRTFSGALVNFDAEDFNAACRYLTGDNLDSVKFTLPDKKNGVLYYEYDASEEKGTAVRSTYSYYRHAQTTSTRLIDEVSLKIPEGYTGSFEIEYSGVSTGDETFEGIIGIVVNVPVLSNINYSGTSLPIPFSLQDFREVCDPVLPKDLAYIHFKTLPSEVYGKVVSDYYGRNLEVTANSRYEANGTPSIDSLSFVPKAGYQGTVSLTYTAVDEDGHALNGTIRITVDNDDLPSAFVDLSGYGWAEPSIQFLYDAGVVNGYGNGIYGPGRSTSRGEYVVMLCRIFDFTMVNGSSFPDVSPDSYYAQAAATAKSLGIVAGVNGNFEADTPIPRQQAVTMLERAMKAAGWPVTPGSSDLLGLYNDGYQVADYARTAMTSMIRMGLISGDDKGNLNPGKNMTRAEIASMLHRMLTM